MFLDNMTSAPLTSRRVPCGATEALLDCTDVFECILRRLDPQSAISLSRTCSAAHSRFYAVFGANPPLLAAVAGNADRALTKTAMVGWFALTSFEASAIKHAVYARKAGGFYYLYGSNAFTQATAIIGRQWASRVAQRRARSTPLARPCPRIDAVKRTCAWPRRGDATPKRLKLQS